MPVSNKLLQRDASIASFSSISLEMRLDAARSARLNSSVKAENFVSISNSDADAGLKFS